MTKYPDWYYVDEWEYAAQIEMWLPFCWESVVIANTFNKY